MPTDTLASLPAVSATSFASVMMVALLANYFIERWLLNRQLRHVAAWRDEVPEPFADRITLVEHQRAADYTLAKGAFTKVESAIGLVVSALI